MKFFGTTFQFKDNSGWIEIVRYDYLERGQLCFEEIQRSIPMEDVSYDFRVFVLLCSVCSKFIIVMAVCMCIDRRTTTQSKPAQ